jgi:ABC-type phosphate transport system substrate-binding protein
MSRKWQQLLIGFLLILSALRQNQQVMGQGKLTKGQCLSIAPPNSTYYFDSKNTDVHVWWEVAQAALGDGSRWREIYDATNQRSAQFPQDFRHMADPNQLANGDCLALPITDDHTIAPNLGRATLTLDGSDTVYPLFQDYLKSQFEQAALRVNSDITVDVNFVDTSSGFQKLCAKQIDVAMASRLLNSGDSCRPKDLIGFVVGSDAIVLIKNNKNTLIPNALMTLDATKQILTGKTLPTEITRYYPAQTTGTSYTLAFILSGAYAVDIQSQVSVAQQFQHDMLYQTGKVLSFLNYETVAEDISVDEDGFGFVPYSYYHKSAVNNNPHIVSLPCLPALLKNDPSALQRNCPSDPIDPTDDTVATRQYPLARPIFIYVRVGNLRQNAALQSFLRYVLLPKNLQLAQQSTGMFGYAAPTAPKDCLESFLASQPDGPPFPTSACDVTTY